MKEGDSIGVIQGVNESLQTSLAAAILKRMGVPGDANHKLKFSKHLSWFLMKAIKNSYLVRVAVWLLVSGLMTNAAV